jgi:hypothetical protein
MQRDTRLGSGRALEGRYEQQQLHEVVVDGCARRLDDENLSARAASYTKREAHFEEVRVGTPAGFPPVGLAGFPIPLLSRIPNTLA